jgi:recombinational DNA repair protein (RecF pathway)
MLITTGERSHQIARTILYKAKNVVQWAISVAICQLWKNCANKKDAHNKLVTHYTAHWNSLENTGQQQQHILHL